MRKKSIRRLLKERRAGADRSLLKERHQVLLGKEGLRSGAPVARRSAPSVQRRKVTPSYLIEKQMKRLEEETKIDAHKKMFVENVMKSYSRVVKNRMKNAVNPLQRKFLMENASAGATSAADAGYLYQLALPLIRRVLPTTFVPEIIGAVPMDMPYGMIPTLRYIYGNTKGGALSGTEALAPQHIVDLARAYSGNENPAFPGPADVGSLEGVTGNTIKAVVTNTPVQVKERKLSSRYTPEAQMFMRSINGIELGEIVAEGVASHIAVEIDQEGLRILRSLPPTPTAFNTYDMSALSGQSITVVDEHAALMPLVMFQLDRIHKRTRIATAQEWMVVSQEIATVLRSANASAFARTTDGKLEPTDNNRAIGVINGTVKVYLDTYATASTPVLVGIKENDQSAAAYFCVYVPIEPLFETISPDTGENVMSFVSMYDYVTFTDPASNLANSADYLGLVGVNPTTLTFR